jgi:ferredoxin
MADKGNKVAGSVPGKYYVDTQCIDCNLCVDTAPENFVKDESAGYSFLFKQPENVEEEAQCKESMESCPVEAIGDDGE